MTNYIRKFELGGLHIESTKDATTYVGDKNDVWTDDNAPGTWRIGDGVTPGGVVLFSASGGGASGIALTDISVVQNPVGIAGLSWNNVTGVLSYTPPDLTGYALSNTVPGDLTELGINDGTNGQVLTTDGAGTFTFTTLPSTGITYTDLSVTQNASAGLGTLAYNNTTGTFTYTPPVIPTDVSDLTDTTNLLSGGGGDASTLDGEAPSYYLDYNNFTNTPTTLSPIDPSINPSNSGESLIWDQVNGWWTNSGLAVGPSYITYTDLSVTQAAASGSGTLAYNNTTGVFTYTPPDLSGYSTFDGDYNSLTNTPTIPADVSDLTDTTNLLGGGSSYGDSDVASFLDGNFNMDIIPDTNDAYDIGSAEYKIRDLYVSDSSIKFVDDSDPLNPVEYPISRNGGELRFNSETIATSSYQVNDSSAPIDITKRIHFIGHGLSYTLANGTYIGQEVHFVYSDVGTGSSTITVDNAKYTNAINDTTARAAFVWTLNNTGPNEKFGAIWDGAGWCLIGGEEQV